MTDSTETVQAPVAPTETKKRQMSFNVLEDGTIHAEFGPGLEALTLNPVQIPESMQAAALTEGVISRARAYTSKLTESNRTPEKLREAVQKGFANMLAGIWKIERAPGEGGADFPIEVEAAHLFRQMRAKAKNEEFTGTLAEAAVNFAALTDDQKNKIREIHTRMLEEFKALQKKQRDEIVALLSEDQKKELQKIETTAKAGSAPKPGDSAEPKKD